MATKKNPTAAPAAAQGGASEEKKMLTVSDERMKVVMRHVNRGLSKAHVTTLEQLIASRLIAVSALTQMVNDNLFVPAPIDGRPTVRKREYCTTCYSLADGVKVITMTQRYAKYAQLRREFVAMGIIKP